MVIGPENHTINISIHDYYKKIGRAEQKAGEVLLVILLLLYEFTRELMHLVELQLSDPH